MNVFYLRIYYVGKNGSVSSLQTRDGQMYFFKELFDWD